MQITVHFWRESDEERCVREQFTNISGHVVTRGVSENVEKDNIKTEGNKGSK